MGANIITNYLGTVGDNTPFAGAITICNPFNLVEITERMKRLPGSIYSRFLVRGLKEFLRRNHQVLSKAPFDMQAAMSSRSVHEFDISCVAPLHGFADVYDYYRFASSSRVAHQITVPLLALGAKDDPLCHPSARPLETCPEQTIYALTNFGGHVGHLEYKSLSKESYIDKVVVAALKSFEEWKKTKN